MLQSLEPTGKRPGKMMLFYEICKYFLKKRKFSTFNFHFSFFFRIFAGFLVPMANKRKIINDPVFGFLTIPNELVYDVLQHPYVQRLSRIRQLGLSNFVYPGAMHSRFLHSLGAMHLMQEGLATLKNKGVELSDSEIIAAEIAILLHDIGHGPFSHVLEHTLVDGITHEEISLLMMEQINRDLQQGVAEADWK